MLRMIPVMVTDLKSEGLISPNVDGPDVDGPDGELVFSPDGSAKMLEFSVKIVCEVLETRES
jgi:hypothetical protein